MKKASIALLLGLVIAGSPLRAQAATVSQAGGGAPVEASTAAPDGAMTLSVRGTIDKFDRSSRVLVLKTPAGVVEFTVAETTRVRQGWRRVDPNDLHAMSGERATVRYTESAGTKRVESVHVFGR